MRNEHARDTGNLISNLSLKKLLIFLLIFFKIVGKFSAIFKTLSFEQVYTAELGKFRLPVSSACSFLMCHMHSCSISTFATFHFLNVYFRIFFTQTDSKRINSSAEELAEPQELILRPRAAIPQVRLGSFHAFANVKIKI